MAERRRPEKTERRGRKEKGRRKKEGRGRIEAERRRKEGLILFYKT